MTWGYPRPTNSGVGLPLNYYYILYPLFSGLNRLPFIQDEYTNYLPTIFMFWHSFGKPQHIKIVEDDEQQGIVSNLTDRSLTPQKTNIEPEKLPGPNRQRSSSNQRAVKLRGVGMTKDRMSCPNLFPQTWIDWGWYKSTTSTIPNVYIIYIYI